MEKIFYLILAMFGTMAYSGTTLDMSFTPELPPVNSFPFCNFEIGSDFIIGVHNTGIKNNTFSIASEGYQSNHSLAINNTRGSIILNTHIPPNTGNTRYILAFRTKSENKGEIGCVVKYDWTKKEKGGPTLLFCYSKKGTGKWERYVSAPFCPKPGLVQIWLNSKGPSGFVDNLIFAKADVKLSFSVKSDCPLVRVSVSDDTGNCIFDSGLLKDSRKSFEKTLDVLSIYTYTLRAEDKNGEIHTLVRPKHETYFPEN